MVFPPFSGSLFVNSPSSSILQPWNDITDAKKSEYVDKKKAYDEETAGAPAATPAAADDDEPKAYTGKKRGRKSNAEKAAIAAAEAKENGASSSRVEDIPVDEPKQKKSKVRLLSSFFPLLSLGTLTDPSLSLLS